MCVPSCGTFDFEVFSEPSVGKSPELKLKELNFDAVTYNAETDDNQWI